VTATEITPRAPEHQSPRITPAFTIEGSLDPELVCLLRGYFWRRDDDASPTSQFFRWLLMPTTEIPHELNRYIWQLADAAESTDPEEMVAHLLDSGDVF
jgi:hypothetical protein